MSKPLACLLVADVAQGKAQQFLLGGSEEETRRWSSEIGGKGSRIVEEAFSFLAEVLIAKEKALYEAA